MSLLNNLNPEILDTNPTLYFHLQQQKLIEFIRNGDIATAIEFAQEELAPRGEENPEFLDELERTMSLLAFDASNSPVSDLLDMSHRQKLASEVNAAILTSFCQEKDPKLPSLLKMLIWAQVLFFPYLSLINVTFHPLLERASLKQNQLEEKVSFPKIRDFATAQLEEPMIQS